MTHVTYTDEHDVERIALVGPIDAERIVGWRNYAANLRDTGRAYITASDAAGMDRNAARRETAEYLRGEGERLIREAATWADMADEREGIER